MTPAPATYSVNSRLLTHMPQYIFLSPMKNQPDGTPYEKADVMENLHLERLVVAVPTYLNGQEFPYFAVCGEPLVRKYIVVTTKKVAYDQLQNPKSNLHNVHYNMPILLQEEVGRNIYIVVLHFFKASAS